MRYIRSPKEASYSAVKTPQYGTAYQPCSPLLFAKYISAWDWDVAYQPYIGINLHLIIWQCIGHTHTHMCTHMTRNCAYVIIDTHYSDCQWHQDPETAPTQCSQLSSG